MNSVESLPFAVRTCCAWENEVWVAKQEGNIGVLDAVSNQVLVEVPVNVDNQSNAVIQFMTAVEDEIWIATLEGKIAVFDAVNRRYTKTISLPGFEKKAALTGLLFDGLHVLIPSETGRTYIFEPQSKKQIGVLAAEAPCTAVTTMEGYFVGGDKEGRLYVWDAETLQCIVRHDKSKSEVRHVLFEEYSRTIWVARENGNIDIYSMAANQLALAARASAVGKVTGLESVSGKIIASTFEKKIVVICALTARVLDVMESSHKSFMCGITKVRRRETASLWTYSNDGGVQTWELQGNFVKVKEGTKTLRKKLSKLSVTNHLQQLAENVQLGVNVQEEKNKYINFRDDLRTAREEAQELRLKLIKLQEELEVKKEEVLKGETRVKELEADNAKCKKDVTEFSEKVSSVEKERAALQSEVGTLKEDLSKARTEVSDKIAENSKVSQEVSLAKTEKSQMEQRLHDAEGKLATIEGENTRLCRSIGSVAAAQGAERDVQNQILKGSEQSRSELERVMKLNKVLSSALASMEYTIRKKEEEEKDLTALLNAYRRKVADRVSDPHLSALLIATMVRNPARFDLECDDITKGELLDRNGPFIQFIHSLRDTDFDAYNKMMEYLQQSSDGTLPPRPTSC
ncbi:hypothetical protein AGDE_10052 [Angomonas deanei]|nr:hypothetical protein AGDE_10052 [Angomonas deanei]|eukprot:EPY29246.1 hypothetical protein AGDE_10052 [Angomonas deanei]